MANWNSGLYDCCNDGQLCIIGTFCPCYVFGQNAEQITGESKVASCFKYCIASGCCLQCVCHKPERQALRKAYSLPEQPSDLLATCLCSPCGNCQERRELTARGVKPGTRIPVSSQPR